MKKERIDRILSGTGRFSRAEARTVIQKGLVTVDGAVVRDPGAKIERSCAVAVRDKAVDTSEFVYYMLNKPAGYVSASEPEGCYPPVTDLLPDELRRRGLQCAGRLDADVTGLLLLTDDGAFAHRIMSPKTELPKTYRVRTDGSLTQEHASLLAGGVTFKNGTAYRPACLCPDPSNESVGLVTVTEGKFHEVKNLMAVCGRRVLALERVSVGGLSLDSSLAPGEGRLLTPEETTLISNC